MKTKICPVCNAQFVTARYNSRKYCSVECRNIAWSIRQPSINKIDTRLPITAIDENGYDYLREAIIRQAVKDYHKSKKREKKEKPPTKYTNVKDLEKWFESDCEGLLSNGQGEYILEHISKI